MAKNKASTTRQGVEVDEIMVDDNGDIIEVSVEVDAESDEQERQCSEDDVQQPAVIIDDLGNLAMSPDFSNAQTLEAVSQALANSALQATVFQQNQTSINTSEAVQAVNLLLSGSFNSAVKRPYVAHSIVQSVRMPKTKRITQRQVHAVQIVEHFSKPKLSNGKH
jgi:hypothetical protein